MAKHCPTCNKNASSSCWKTHLGWCPTHQTTFAYEPSEYSDQTGPPCRTCLNLEWEATETYSQIQADTATISIELQSKDTRLGWAKQKAEHYDVSSEVARLEAAIGMLKARLKSSESQTRSAYDALSRAAAARKASQNRFKA